LKKPLALYLHIPFCEHKCIYCDFYSIIKQDRFGEYTAAIIKELEYYSQLYHIQFYIKTIFFGGGTPSLLPINFFERIVNSIYKNFEIDENYEFTIEANPNSANDKLQNYKRLGVNRISFGVQSFNKKDLEFITRIHNKNQAIKSVYQAYETGFENISIDLIFNLPTQSLKTIKKNLEIAISLPIKHISYYSLILENGTQLYSQVLKGKVKLKDENFDLKLYEYIIDCLESNGFIQYEVSNFAKSGYQCEHNKIYWHYGDYLGIGSSAHSFVNNERFWNYRNLTKYIESVNQKGNSIKSKEVLTKKQNYVEYLMLSLRSDGLDLNKLKDYSYNENKFEQFNKYLNELIKLGLIVFVNEKYKLTKRGYPVADKIIELLL